MSNPCHTPNCEGTVGDNSAIGLCKRCYSSILYWHKKSPKQLIKRAQQVQVFRGRMDLLMPSSTATMPYKKPAKPLAVMPGESRKIKKRKVRKSV